MTDRLTYELLFKKLNHLGYQRETGEVNGTRAYIFRHPDHPGASIFLPEVSLKEPVLPMHLGAVRLVLTTHGIVEDDSEQLFLQMLAVHERSRSGKS